MVRVIGFVRFAAAAVCAMWYRIWIGSSKHID